jgi:hypothetical protein
METENCITIPFTYRIICPDGNNYYGVRYAVGCNPTDLWNTYFTSSKEIKKLLSVYRSDDFKCEIRKTFSNIQDAISYETRVLQKVAGKINWLNKNVSGDKFYNSGPHTTETKEKISKSLIGNKQSPETIKKRSDKNKGKKRINPHGHIARQSKSE